MGTMYNPMNVLMGNPGKTGTPYLNPKPVGGGSVGPITNPMTNQDRGKPTNSVGLPARPMTSGNPAPQGGIVGPESVRATGTGAFDPAYRQDLATFAGGLFGRPGGSLDFNPTSNQPFGGAATGGGNAPVMGMPNTLLQNALGGNPFSYNPPMPAQGATNSQPDTQTLQDWLNKFMQSGKNQRLAY